MTDIAKVVEAALEDLPEALLETIRAASQARNGVTSGEHEDDVLEIHHNLVQNRKQIERLEYLTAQLGILKTRTAKAVASRQAEYDDAYMKAATKPTIGFSEYATAKEKDATFNLSTVAETLSLRKATASHADVNAAWDYCRVLLRGAEGTQRDLETRIRLISLTGALDR